MIVAHILGLPVEETVPELVQFGAVVLIAGQLIRGYFRRGRRRG